MNRSRKLPTRPVKPDVDPLYLKVRTLLARDRRSTFAKAAVSGLSQATLTNWAQLRVRRPQSVSLQMAARALGYRLELVRDRK